MQEVARFPHGTFSWVDLTTTDQEGAKQFYTAVFGWETTDIPIDENNVYTMFNLNGKNVAAVSAMQPEQQAQGMPPHWTSYITVDNVDEVAGKVEEAGGTLMAPPFDVMGSGRMAVIQDPTGAIVALWQPINHIGASYINVPGSLSWNELNTRDAEKAGEFFNKLLGWEVGTQTEPNPYMYFLNNGRMNGGMMQMTEEWGDIPPNWMVYFAVENFDATLEKIKAEGGTIHVGPVDAPEVGRFGVIADPQGAMFTAIQLEQVDEVPPEWM